MGNAIGKNLTGKVVLISTDALREKYHAKERRAFLVENGFGASPATAGTALFGRFVFDNDETRMDGYSVDAEAGIVADSLDEYDGPIHEDLKE